MSYIDLHIHTNHSDGTDTPEEVVKTAAKCGVSAIAVCDHDTAAGAAEAVLAGKEMGIEVIPGIEISADYLGIEGIHILGYFIDPEAPALTELLAWVIAERERRNGCIADIMRADGLDVSLELLRDKYKTDVVGRPHFGAFLADCGVVGSVKEAFDLYLSPGGKYYVKRRYIPIELTFSVIEKSGGKAVLAHPFQYGFDHEEMVRLVKTAKSYGAVGIECLYSGYSREQSEYLLDMAKRFGMCPTGGSDYHGRRKPHIKIGSGTGSLKVPYEYLENLKRA